MGSGTRRRVARFALACLASCLAGLVNPYGLGLYRHVVRLLLSSGVTSMIDEYQPAPFGQSRALILELIVLALIGLPAVVRARPGRYAMVHLLVWLHLASPRSATRPCSPWRRPRCWRPSSMPCPSRSAAGARSPENGLSGCWGAVGVLLLLLALRVPLGGFDPRDWPLHALATLDRQPASARLFHELNWGGLIAAECRPRRLTYADDRFELIGRDGVIELAQALDGGPTWEKIRDRDRIDLVLIGPDRGLSRRLLADPDWRLLHRGPVSFLFAHTPRKASGRQIVRCSTRL